MFKRCRVDYSENKTLWYLVLTSLDWPEQLVSARTCKLFNQILNDTHVRSKISEKIYNCFVYKTHDHTTPKPAAKHYDQWFRIHSHIHSIPNGGVVYPQFTLSVGYGSFWYDGFSDDKICSEPGCNFFDRDSKYADYKYQETVYFPHLTDDTKRFFEYTNKSPDEFMFKFLPVKHCALTQLLTIVNKYMDNNNSRHVCSCYKRYIDMCRK